MAKKPNELDPARIDPRNPTNHLAPEERKRIKSLARIAVLRGGRPRNTLPRCWADTIWMFTITGQSMDDIAVALGTNPVTFAEMRERDPRIDAVRKAAENDFKTIVLQPIVEAAKNGNVNAAIFLASRRWSAEFGEKPQLPATSNTLVLPAPMTMEQLRELFQQPAIEHKS